MSANPSQLQVLAFGGLNAAKPRIDANYERAGVYWERIDKIKLDKTRKEEVGLFLEKTVIAVFDERLADQPAGRVGHRVGENVTHAIWKKHDSFLGNVKSMISGVMALPVETVEEAHAYAICADDQPLTGTVIEVDSRVIETKKKTPFTVINYKREVPPSEVLAHFTKLGTAGAELKERFFPNQWLERVVAAEKAAAQPAAPAA